MVTDGLLDFILFARIIYLQFPLRVSSYPLVRVPGLRWERTREMLRNKSWKTTLSVPKLCIFSYVFFRTTSHPFLIKDQVM